VVDWGEEKGFGFADYFTEHNGGCDERWFDK
jgi:hypothetical protein